MNSETIRIRLKAMLQSPEKFVCVGLGKTGTTTFASAMRRLGFAGAPYNVTAVGFGHENRKRWPIARALSKYDSFEDFPWPYMYEYVEEKYPRARFVLTRRVSAEAWLESLKKHYARRGPSEANRIFSGYYSPHQNPEHHIRLYEGHIERVRDHFRGRPNFLEVCWEEGDSWEELCGFVGAPVPDEPFPRRNAAPSVDYEALRREADIRLEQMLRVRMTGSRGPKPQGTSAPSGASTA